MLLIIGARCHRLYYPKKHEIQHLLMRLTKCKFIRNGTNSWPCFILLVDVRIRDESQQEQGMSCGSQIKRSIKTSQRSSWVKKRRCVSQIADELFQFIWIEIGSYPQRENDVMLWAKKPRTANKGIWNLQNLRITTVTKILIQKELQPFILAIWFVLYLIRN